jgi:hypothetical protein
MNERQAFENVVDQIYGNDRKKMKEIVKELSISVACLLDDLEDFTEEDIEYIQDLVTKLENIVDPVK